MSLIYDIVHRTCYRYHQAVSFGLHRVMFRPRDSHDQRVLATGLEVSPQADVRLIQDAHSNSIACVQPLQSADQLEIVAQFSVEQVHGVGGGYALARAAEVLPLAYASDERLDLEHYLRPHHDDPDGVLSRWARSFLSADGPTPTMDLLQRMNRAVRDQLAYGERYEHGTQSPAQTLRSGGGSCRDFALLMMEAVRHLGLAARFVTGYLYDPATDIHAPMPSDAPVITGAGSTHAWLQVFLPGAGWVEFDPTNQHVGPGGGLIRVAVVRDPSQAAPITGTWMGPAQAFAGMDVSVQVTLRRT